MKEEEFFEDWKGDWEGRKEEFHTNQAELFRRIRDRKNLKWFDLLVWRPVYSERKKHYRDKRSF